MAILTLIFENLLDALETAVLNHEDTENIRQDILDAIKRNLSVREKDAACNMLVNLYRGRYEQLKADISKLILVGGDITLEDAECTKATYAMWIAIQEIFKGDYSSIIDECQDAISNDVNYFHHDLPYS